MIRSYSNKEPMSKKSKKLDNDLLKKFWTIIDFSPQGVSWGLATLVIIHRDLQIVILTVGMLVNLLINSFLKYLIAEPRPRLPALKRVSIGYGMPSAHAQFMWFISIYIFFFVYKAYTFKFDIIKQLNKASVITFLFVWSSLVSLSRVHQRYHTPQQVICGIFVGSLLASIWFFLTQNLFGAFFLDHNIL